MSNSNETVETSGEQTTRKYRKAPVVEALCEIFFEGSEWDDAVVGEFYGRVKHRFPKRNQEEVQQAESAVASTNSTGDATSPAAPMQFLNETRNSILQLRKNLLVVNQLQPYPTFADWRPNIEFALEHYWELAKPRGVKRIGLRYINRIVIPESPIRMEHYFGIYPNLPQEMGDVHGGYMVRVQIPCSQTGHAMLITLASAPADDPKHTAHLLDLYATFQSELPAGKHVVIAQTTAAHENVEKTFESSITDRLRNLFEPIA
jgi:uncharacterized protein (TIGR04255 family)